MNRAVLKSLASTGLLVMAGGAMPGAVLAEALVTPLAADCAALAQVGHMHTTIERAVAVEVDTDTNTASAGNVKMPAHCLVRGELFARIGVNGVRYSMGFELRLPFKWNRRFIFQGGGGVDGTIRPALGTLRAGVTPALAQGAAVVTSDMGHTGTNNADARFGLDPQARIDWGYHALDQVTRAAKALTARFYGAAPAHAYFIGVSGGGRQGMILAQRFPHHFDGIVSGAPILEQHLAQLGSMQMLQAFAAIAPKTDAGVPILSQSFSDADLALIADGVLRRCDALDGAADGLIENHVACTYSAAELQCPGAKEAGCLSPAQVGAFDQVMAGPRNSAGVQAVPRHPVGHADRRPRVASHQHRYLDHRGAQLAQGHEPIDQVPVHDASPAGLRLLQVQPGQ